MSDAPASPTTSDAAPAAPAAADAPVEAAAPAPGAAAPAAISAFADPPAATADDATFAQAAAATPPAGAAVPAEAEADAGRCLPPPLPFSRIALAVVVALLVALTALTWTALRATRDLGRAVGAPPPAPPEAAPTPTQLADDTWFAAACRDHPERAVPLWRARAHALAGAGDATGALAAWDALARAGRGDATLDDALGRAETLADLRRWDDALATLARIAVADAPPAQQRRAIALDGRCRLARDRAAR